MRYFFFLFVLLKESIISSLSYQVSKSSTVLFHPPAPSPIPGLSGSPFLVLKLMCHCSDRPLGSSLVGGGPLLKAGCHHAAKGPFRS